VSDRHDRPLGSAQNFNPDIELLGKRRHDAGAEPGSSLIKGVVLLPDPVVRNRQLPIRSGDIIRNFDLLIYFVVGNRVRSTPVP
jgi:hypothetical protein